MIKMTQDELNEAILLHGKYLRGEKGGKRADFSGMDLSGLDFRGRDLTGACMSGTNLARTNMIGTNLTDAELWGATLIGADMTGVDMSQADLTHAIGNRREVKSMLIDKYHITYTRDRLFIGCEEHTIDEWRGFSDEKIFKMDGRQALEFWRDWKDTIFNIIEKSPAVPTGC